MKIHCGTDIIEVGRVRESVEKSGDNFLNMVYTPKEIEYCESKRVSKYYHYAGRFAAKEAIFKAVAHLLENKYDLSWQNLEIVNDENGAPKVNFINVKIDKIQDIDISISHCKEYATAVAVVVNE